MQPSAFSMPCSLPRLESNLRPALQLVIVERQAAAVSGHNEHPRGDQLMADVFNSRNGQTQPIGWTPCQVVSLGHMVGISIDLAGGPAAPQEPPMRGR
jgi:hypothetical protein